MADNREKIIVRTGIVGIATNVMLASFKALVGMSVHSIAMVLDALNNLSDVMSSLVTIIGTKIAGKKPDKKHPMGHGRVEYLSQMLVAAIILYAGVTALWESVQKIIKPVVADYTPLSLTVISVAIVAKIILGLYVKKQGSKAKSELLKGSGTDALFDAVLSGAVLVSAIIYIVTKVSLEAYVSVLISAFIIKAGYSMIRDAVDEMLGHRVEGELIRKIKGIVVQIDGVHGAYDIILHNYGPEHYLGSLHVEVDDTMTAAQFDALTRDIEEAVFTQTKVILTAVGLYSRNTGNDSQLAVRSEITRLVMDHENVLQMHGFYIDEKRKRITFDIIIDFDDEDRDGLYRHILEDVQKAAPGYEIKVTLDRDVSDIDDN